MKAFFFTLAIGAVMATSVVAQTAVTATCKDGTSFSGTTRTGACGGHGGVQAWGPAATVPAPGSASAPVTTATPAASAPPGKPTASTPAPGGGPGQVWVNTASKVYH